MGNPEFTQCGRNVPPTFLLDISLSNSKPLPFFLFTRKSGKFLFLNLCCEMFSFLLIEIGLHTKTLCSSKQLFLTYKGVGKMSPNLNFSSWSRKLESVGCNLQFSVSSDTKGSHQKKGKCKKKWKSTKGGGRDQQRKSKSPQFKMHTQNSSFSQSNS